MIKKLFLFGIIFILFSLPLVSKEFTYTQIHQMPKSVEKDYYIWRFLSQKNTTISEAKAILYEVNNLNKKLRVAYKKKTSRKAYLPKANVEFSKEKKKAWANLSNANRLFSQSMRFIQQNKLQKAADTLYKAHNIYIKRWEKDKCLFWIFLLTQDKSYLDTLRRSNHINIYTLLAADFTNASYPNSIIFPKFNQNNTSHFNATNPIHWARIKASIKEDKSQMSVFVDQCDSDENIGVYSYLKAKECNYEKSYFPLPYRQTMRHFSIERQALIYAIARQESRFIPGSVSRSFALGMMQFMPFLIKGVAKKKGEKIDLDDIFNPIKSIEYADFHLDYLEKYLMHPLFIAYAYNGGIGFTKRLIKKPSYFRKGNFEPYLSMEKIKNVEAREYGKRVLTNYIIYLNKLGKPSRILPYINDLTSAEKTDSFRR